MYDPLVSLSVTIRGQLRQLMLIEDFSIADLQIVSANTDGVVVLTTGDEENDVFKKICKEWESKTGYELEETLYNLLVMRDVNNYLAIKQGGKIKLKGVFEIDKELHKNHSMRIVRKALVKFYSENIPVETTIYESKDIKDFLLAVKFRGSHGIVKGIKNNEWVEEYYKRNFRYFISNNGQPLLKIFDKGDRETRVNVGYLITPFNKFFDVADFSDYDVNYNFYIEECNKVIRKVNTVVPLQLELNL